MTLDDAIRSVASQFPELKFDLRREGGLLNVMVIYPDGVDRSLALQAKTALESESIDEVFVVDVFGGDYPTEIGGFKYSDE